MQDEFAIQQTLNAYTLGATLRDFDQLMSTFLDDGVWEVPGVGLRLQGKAAIRPAMEGFVAQMAYFAQINSPALITVTGDTATARSVIRECGKYAGRDEGLEVLGVYDDDLVRAGDGWKFARRCFRGIGSHQFPLQAAPKPL